MGTITIDRFSLENLVPGLNAVPLDLKGFAFNHNRDGRGWFVQRV